MKLSLKTPVNGSVQQVFAGFDRQLFTALSPALMAVKIERFDGCTPGDEVHLRLPVGRWVSVITAREVGEQEAFFTDEGKLLPVPFVFWRHRHIVRSEKSVTCIVEDIEYKTKAAWLDRVVWPFLWILFSARGPIYKRYFAERP